MAETLLQHDQIIKPEDVDNPGLLNTAVEKRYLKIVEDLLKYGADVNMLTDSRFEESLTPLHSAVKDNYVQMAKLLINYGANVNVKDGHGKTPIVYATRNRNTEMTELLLTNGADVKDNPNLLYTAVKNGILKIVEDLLKYGADVNMLTRSKFGRDITPLHSAVKDNYVKMAKLLINYGANVNVKDGKEKTPIVYAIRNRNTKMTELLLTNGADIKEDRKVLCTAVENGFLKIVEDLLEDGADVNMLSSSIFESSLTLLHDAVNGKQVEMAKLLINYGANVNVKDGKGKTPIVYAIRNRNTEMTGLLLTNGADIKDNPNLLYTAIENGSLKIVEDLLKYGADVNVLTRSKFGRGITPLHSAAHGKQVEMAKLLINYGAHVNVKDDVGKTPIVYAIQKNDTEMTELLLINGADIKDNPNLLYTVVKNGILKIVEDLLKYGADVNMLTRSKFGRDITLLHSAVKDNYVQMAKLLINYGANVNVKDGKRKTPIVYAIRNRNTKMTGLLLTNGADIKDNPNLLYTAIENGSLKIVEDLLKYDADVNMLTRSKFGRGTTPLHNAAHGKQVEIAKLLINYGAHVNVKDDMGKTPIVYAIQNNDTEMTELLLSNGADIKKDPKIQHAAVQNGILKIVEDLLKDGANVNMLTSSYFGKDLTLLHSAIEGKQVEIAKQLINYGANVNVKDGHGKIPIVYAIQNNDTEMTELLLINGADIKEDPEVLHAAVQNGSLKMVEVLLKYGADVNMLSSSLYRLSATALHSAVKEKQVEMAKLLINYGANVNVKDGHGKTPIVYAIQNNDTEMTELLLSNGTDIKEDTKVQHAAVQNGILKIVEDLLKDGANVNMITSSHFGKDLTLLHSAIEGKQVEIAKLLINYGANVNVKDGNGKTPIVYAIQNNDTEMTELLLTNGADIKDPNLLYTAVDNGSLKIVEDLLKYGADVNMLTRSKFGRGITPLHSAVHGMQVEMAKLLINCGANVNVKNGEGKTPILYTIKKRDTEMTELLLINGADINGDPKVLHAAVQNGSLKMVEVLLKYGADVNARDQYGRTALHYTVLRLTDNERRLESCYNMRYMHRKQKIAELLLSKGANVNVETKSGITTLFAASLKGCEDIVEILLKYDAECDPETEEDTKPLHAAAVGGHSKIIENLLKFGAKVDSKDIYGRTALHFASKQGHKQIVRTLLEYGSDVNIISKKNHTPLEYGMLIVDFANASDSLYNYVLRNDEDLRYKNDFSTTKLLIQHIALVKAAGLHVSERNLLCISNNHEINNFLHECEAEILIMKSKKIDNSCASFYDILTKNTSDLAKNESIVQALKSDNYETKFPIYASTIDSRFRRGVEREELLEQVRNKFLHSLFESLPELPLLCTERIFSYLSDKDLRILLVACKLFDKNK